MASAMITVDAGESGFKIVVSTNQPLIARKQLHGDWTHWPIKDYAFNLAMKIFEIPPAVS